MLITHHQETISIVVFQLWSRMSTETATLPHPFTHMGVVTHAKPTSVSWQQGFRVLLQECGNHEIEAQWRRRVEMKSLVLVPLAQALISLTSGLACLP